MSEALRILIVEDSADDAALLVRELRRAGYDVVSERVESAAALNVALDGARWDLVVADYALPHFSGLDALALVQERGLDLPFIVVSGAITEETAVGAMRAGAHDYVLKGNLARLGPVVARELREARARRDRQRAEAELKELKERTATELRRSRDQLEAILRSAAEGIVARDAAGKVVYANDAAERSELFDGALPLFDEAGERLAPEALPSALAMAEGHPVEKVVRGPGRASEARWYVISATPMLDEGRQAWMVITVFREITAQKRAEAQARLLADAGASLAGSLDVSALLRALAGLAVPALGDFCAVELEPADGVERQLEVAHVDAQRAGLLRELFDRPELRAALGAAERTSWPGEVELLGPIAKDAVPAGFAALFQPGPLRAMSLPLTARGQRIGTICVGAASGEHRWSAEALEAGRELAWRGALALENAELYQRARRAIATRDEFLSIASHELRTPLTTLLLQLQRLRRSPLPDGFAPVPAVDQAIRQAHRMTGLIETMLDVSRVSAGRLTLQREPVDLEEVIRQVVARFDADAEAADCTVSVEAKGSLEGQWDRGRMDQVLTNLLSNAIKYGRGGQIEVRASGSGDSVTVTVRDHGIGIAEVDRSRIFSRFERAVSPRHFGGLGLGLFIVRQIVEGHGGTVDVESRPGEGSTFTVVLPRTAKAAELPAVH